MLRARVLFFITRAHSNINIYGRPCPRVYTYCIGTCTDLIKRHGSFTYLYVFFFFLCLCVIFQNDYLLDKLYILRTMECVFRTRCL